MGSIFSKSIVHINTMNQFTISGNLYLTFKF